MLSPTQAYSTRRLTFYASVDTTNHPIVYNDNEILEHKWVNYRDLLEAVKTGIVKDSYTLTALSKAIISGFLPLK